jgi:release factor glutamine methyltransferase
MKEVLELRFKNATLQLIRLQLNEIFGQARIEPSDLEARRLMEHVTGLDRTQMMVQSSTRRLTAAETDKLVRCVLRRLAREPIARITGERHFYGRPFIVTPAVLDPRPETETIIDAAKKLYPDATQALRLLDIGTGTGCLAITLLHEFPQATAVATDASADALDVARRNAAAYGLAGRIDFAAGETFAPITGTFDLIVSNPPYIATAVIATLGAEVRREPVLALDGGADGLGFYDRICAAAREHLAPGGGLVVEHGFDQAEAVRERFAAAGFHRIELVRDLAKNPRVTSGIAP